MFGFHKLTHDGTAVVVSASNAAHSMAIKGNGLTKTNYDLIVDVYPVGAAPFRQAGPRRALIAFGHPEVLQGGVPVSVSPALEEGYVVFKDVLFHLLLVIVLHGFPEAHRELGCKG